MQEEKDKIIEDLWSQIQNEWNFKTDMLDELDLDQYNLTSDDLWDPDEKKIKANLTKGHPLVPWLDF